MYVEIDKVVSESATLPNFSFSVWFVVGIVVR